MREQSKVTGVYDGRVEGVAKTLTETVEVPVVDCDGVRVPAVKLVEGNMGGVGKEEGEPVREATGDTVEGIISHWHMLKDHSAFPEKVGDSEVLVVREALLEAVVDGVEETLLEKGEGGVEREMVWQLLAEGVDEVVEDPEAMNEENGEGVMVEEVEEQVVTVAEDVTWPSSKGRDKRRRKKERAGICWGITPAGKAGPATAEIDHLVGTCRRLLRPLTRAQCVPIPHSLYLPPISPGKSCSLKGPIFSTQWQKRNGQRLLEKLDQRQRQSYSKSALI